MGVHAKNLNVSLDGDDITIFTNKCEIEREADALDDTPFGVDAKTYTGSLLDGTGKLEGNYTAGDTGPSGVIEPLLGNTVELVYKPEGTGIGKPIKTVDVVVKKYAESSEVGGLIKWSAELQLTGPLVATEGL